MLHEVVHSDRLLNGLDFSYRALARVALLKLHHPAHVHTLLANHELAQAMNAGIVKAGVRVVEAFNKGLEYVFADDAPAVAHAINAFVRSMALALRCCTPAGDILCAHSLPGVSMMPKFDPTVLDRPLTDDDFAPRSGSAHLMVWGRGYDEQQLEDLVERWGVRMFILGHEHVHGGVKLVPPNALVLNSDHESGMYLPLNLAAPPTPAQAVFTARPLAAE